MFALVDPSGSDMLLMRRVNLTVPRTIYVDDIEPRQTAVGQLVEKLLPRMRVPANLYEFPIDEALFAARMAELNVQMCQMRINGVYETRVPLLFKAIAHCGVLCHVGTRRNPTELALDTITRVIRLISPL
jgi:DNA polymerase epsilon subunit 1